jgi:hypothetical protein
MQDDNEIAEKLNYAVYKMFFCQIFDPNPTEYLVFKNQLHPIFSQNPQKRVL